MSTEPLSSVQNELKLLKDQNRRLSDKTVLLRERKKDSNNTELKCLKIK